MKEILQLLDNNKGIVLGEHHMSRAPLKFLIDNAEAFASKGVTHIFTEKFRSEKESKFNELFIKYVDTNNENNLEGFCGIANDELEKRKNYFSTQSDFKETEEMYSMINFLRKMKEVGITVIGIDSVGIIENYPVHAEGQKGAIARADSIKIKNQHMLDCIKANEERGRFEFLPKQYLTKKMKFVIWVGCAHASIFINYQGKGMAGLSETLKIPSVHMYEVGLYDIPFEPDKLLKNVKYQLLSTKEDCASKKTQEGHYAAYFVSTKVTDSPVSPALYLREYQASKLENSAYSQSSMYPVISNSNNVQSPQTDNSNTENPSYKPN